MVDFVCVRLSAEEAEHRLKFLSAGREDVDVRCLGEGRPFAIEVSASAGKGFRLLPRTYLP